MLVDCHMHSRFSFDAQPDTVQQIAEASIERGLSTIAITDHKDYFYHGKPPMELDVPGVLAEIDAVRAQYDGKIEAEGHRIGRDPCRPGCGSAARSLFV